MRKLLSMMLAVVMLFTAIPFVYASPSFSDVSRNHWAYDAITTMADKGIIKGYSDGTFRPDNRITRAEFAKIMIAAAGIELSSRGTVKQTFKDVDRDHWAFLYVELAKNYLTGYKSGSTYTYKPNDYAVREDIAVALVRLMGYDRTKKANLSTLDKFRDEDRISKALRPYIAIAVDSDLIHGFNDSTFRPQNAITRAEAATLLYRAQLDETKVVFPVDPKPETPEKTISITDSFTNSSLPNWNAKNGTASWLVVNNKVTAYSNDTDLDHFFLPLSWKEDTKPKNYEIQVDVMSDQTNAYGGLFFNGQDQKATVIYFTKDTFQISKVEDPKKKEAQSIAKVSFKSQKNNKLKIVVKDNNYSIYVNGSFVYGQEDQQLTGTKLGLYLNREAIKNVPDDFTFFDNFSFKVLPE